MIFLKKNVLGKQKENHTCTQTPNLNCITIYKSDTKNTLVKLGNIIYCIKIIFSYSKKSKHLYTVLLYSITWKMHDFFCTFFDIK